MNFTHEQEQAIFSRGEDILVSAGAGAGKTRVLVTRITEMILDPRDPVSADAFLVLTFTNAAAGEMKERIIRELESRRQSDPDNRELRRQIRMVKHADISTVHSFCHRLIRSHFHVLGLDPSFRIGEDGELKLMKQEVMESLLEDRYQEGEESFLQLVEACSPGRDDRYLEDLIGNLYTFSRGFPDVEGWFSDAERNYLALTEESSAGDTLVIRNVTEDARRRLTGMKSLIEKGLDYFKDNKEPYPVYEYILMEKEMIGTLLEAETFSILYDRIHKTGFPRYPQKRGKLKEWVYYDEVKEIHDQVKAGIETLQKKHFLKSMSTVRMEQKEMYPLFRESISLVREFESRYAAKKKEKNLYDFDDLEHFALALLVDHYREDGSGVPSREAREIASRYRAVFVDEYQDTSLVQETLLNTLKEAGAGNVFVVGDVKQSIYRFRQARPDLFLARYRRYTEGEGTKIELRDNFRSSPDVLRYCNRFFARWMKRDFGGIEYDDTVSLRPGEHSPMAEERESQEALLMVRTKDSGEEDLEKSLSEAVMIGEKIRKLHEEGYAYRDIVILLRSLKGYGEMMADCLESLHIPILCESKVGYFQSREIRVILNYLSVIDNLYQDIPMASVMLSGIGGFSPGDLAELKIPVTPEARRELSLYELMHVYLEEGEDAGLKERILSFLEQLHGFRRKKQEMLLHELIWDIYRETGFYDEVLSMSRGRKRRENLMMLLKHAEDYEKTVFKGLFYFIRHMEQLQTYEVELGGGSVKDSVEDAVRMLTIHKSKGLEFPVVFVSALSKQFNLTDLNAKILFHPEIGIGMEYFDMEERTSSPTVMKTAIREKLRKETLEEELRILYVAMTRAQKKLILTGVPDEKKMGKAEDGNLLLFPDQAGCLMDWVLPVLADQAWNDCTIYHVEDIRELLDSFLRSGQKISYEEMCTLAEETRSDADPVRKAFQRSYPWRDYMDRKRKYSVSELKKLAQKTLPEEEIPMWEVSYAEEEEPVPAFLREEAPVLRGTEYGTLVHKVMELLPFGQIKTGKELFDEMEKVWESVPGPDDIDVSLRKRIYHGVEAFLFSEYGSIFSGMDRKGKLRKELPFTIGLDASEVYPDSAGGETIVLQGIIDLCGEDEEEKLWLLDYKTDRIGPGEESLLLDRYKTQMLYYKIALERMTGKKVCRSMIYSFALERFLPVE